MYHQQVTSPVTNTASPVSSSNATSNTDSQSQAPSTPASSVLDNTTTAKTETPPTPATTAPDPQDTAYTEPPSLTRTISPTITRDFASPGMGRGNVRICGDIVDTTTLKHPITFAFSGRTAMNRLLKAPMTERLCRWNAEGEDIVRSPLHMFPIS